MNASPKSTLARLFTSLLLLAFTASLSAAKAKIEKQNFTSNNKKRTVYLFVPETKPDEKVPLLLVFHGSGHNGLSLVDKWQDLAARENFVVAGLDSLDSSVWSTTADSPGVLRDLVETLESKYPINPRRIYLFGHSGGAVFAIDVAMIESEYFAAVAVHAGSWRERDEFEIIRSARRKIPLAIWVGTRDPFFSLASARSTRDALTANGFHAELTEMPGHDHWYYDLAPKINEGAWQFLKQYELPVEPHYSEFVEANAATDANKLIAEVGVLQSRVIELVKQANAFESQIDGKDLARDRADLQKIAAQQIDLLKQAAGMAGAAADKAQRASQMKIGEKNQTYLQATARYYLRFGELLDAERVEAETLLGDDAPQVITTKRNDARKKVESLQIEVDELRRQVEKAMP
jgi:predicted esterase